MALANPKLAELVRHTVLPVLFVELVGPHLRVSALASPADATVVCEPLTPYLHLFSMHRFQPGERVCSGNECSRARTPHKSARHIYG